jgi:hypothetical protein
MANLESRYHPAAMLAVVFTFLLLAVQDPAPAGKQAPAEPPAPPAAVTTWDDKTVKPKLDEFTKLQRAATNLVDKNRALEVIAGGSHKSLVKPLAAIVEADKLVLIRKRAAELLANQPTADANAAIRKLLKSAKVAAYPAVQAELVKGLAKCGYDKSHWADIADLFEREYQQERVPLQEAILDLVARHKEKQAVDMMLRNLDEPAPVGDIDAGDNPPAEYWEARWKSWKAFRPKVQETLFVLTGQRFSDAKEARAWLQKNPLK